MRQTGPGLASIVVELHQTEDQVRRHKLELIRWVGYNETEERRRRKDNSQFDSHPTGFPLRSWIRTLLSVCSFN